MGKASTEETQFDELSGFWSSAVASPNCIHSYQFVLPAAGYKGREPQEPEAIEEVPASIAAEVSGVSAGYGLRKAPGPGPRNSYEYTYGKISQLRLRSQNSWRWNIIVCVHTQRPERTQTEPSVSKRRNCTRPSRVPGHPSPPIFIAHSLQ